MRRYTPGTLLGAVIALGMAAIVCAGCSEDTAAPKTAQAPVAATPAPPAKPADTKEALAEHNRMMQRQREYWLKHGQGH